GARDQPPFLSALAQVAPGVRVHRTRGHADPGGGGGWVRRQRSSMPRVPGPVRHGAEPGPVVGPLRRSARLVAMRAVRWLVQLASLAQVGSEAVRGRFRSTLSQQDANVAPVI